MAYKIPNWLAFHNRFKQLKFSILKGTHDYYTSFFPAKIGFFSSKLLSLYYSGIKLDTKQTDRLKQLPDDAIIVYCNKFKSRFEFIFYHTRYKQLNLPVPEIGFEYKIRLWQPLSRLVRIALAHSVHVVRHFKRPEPYQGGYFRKELLNGRTAFLSLVEKKGFYRRFVKEATDPVQYLIELQQAVERPIYIVPQLMFFGKNPSRSVPSLIDVLFGPEARPGRLRKVATLFRSPQKIFMEISEPVNLKIFLARPDNQQRSAQYLALVIRRNLLHQITRHRQSITGPVLKSNEELKECILTNDRFRPFMDQYSRKRNLPLQKVHKQADSYLDEIAARYSPLLVKIAHYIVNWILNSMFDGVSYDVEELNRVKHMARRGPVILVPCHRSHIDYLVLPYIMYSHNLPAPHVAAGKNLFFWPVAPILRAGGAFSIRRTFRGAMLYAKVFGEYIHKLLEEGFNIEIFIEGGRSRDGKMIMPKLGFLSILLNAFKGGACEDMIFAPVYIGYDRVLEESAYMHEVGGGKKEPESLKQIIQARRFLKKRYGRIYLKFHEPLSIRQLTTQAGKDITQMSTKEQNALCREIGHRMINAINRISVVTPHALVASAILNCGRNIFDYDHMLGHVHTYMNYLYAVNVNLADTLMVDHHHAVEHAAEAYVQRKFVEKITGTANELPETRQFKIVPTKRPSLEYYKNNCVSFFVPAAYTALSILAKDAFQFAATDLHNRFRFLQDLFKNEFALDIDRPAENYVRKTLKAFIDDAILMPHPTLPDTYNLTSSGFRKLKLFARFLKTPFESYWVVLNYFMSSSKNSHNDKERLKKIQSLGNQMHKRKEIVRNEALSRIYFRNASSYFIAQGIKGSENSEKIEFFTQKIKQYMNYL